MEGKLIKTDKGNYVLVDPTKSVYDEGYMLGSSRESDVAKLCLKNCQAIERGYDLDDCVDYFEKGKLYIQQDGVIILAGENGNNGIIIQDPLKTRGVGHYSDEWNPKAFCEFKQEALEILGDKKFTEEDVRIGMDRVWSWCNGGIYQECTLMSYVKDKHIQSLQQTEWDVTFDPEEKDAEGRLILKRK